MEQQHQQHDGLQHCSNNTGSLNSRPGSIALPIAATGADPGIYFGGQTKVHNRKLRAKPESRGRSARVSRAKPESRA